MEKKKIKDEAVKAEPKSVVYNVQIFVKEIISQDPLSLSRAEKTAEISLCVWTLRNFFAELQLNNAGGKNRHVSGFISIYRERNFSLCDFAHTVIAVDP